MNIKSVRLRTGSACTYRCTRLSDDHLLRPCGRKALGISRLSSRRRRVGPLRRCLFLRSFARAGCRPTGPTSCSKVAGAACNLSIGTAACETCRSTGRKERRVALRSRRPRSMPRRSRSRQERSPPTMRSIFRPTWSARYGNPAAHYFWSSGAYRIKQRHHRRVVGSGLCGVLRAVGAGGDTVDGEEAAGRERVVLEEAGGTVVHHPFVEGNHREPPSSRTDSI
jgi:hypothetical protein